MGWPTLHRISNTNSWRRIIYSAWAPLYDHLARAFKAQRRRALELAAPKAGERVLLVGAGTGLDLEVMPPGPQLMATDLTPAMLEILKKRAQRLGLAVDARVMDGQALEFPDGSFDWVILHLILAVIPDPVRCLREAVRVLRPGGHVLIFDKFLPDGERPPLFFRLINPVLSFLGTEVTRQLGPILEGSGLTITHEEPAGGGGILKIVILRK